MKRLTIPELEKEKGMIWVVYLVCQAYHEAWMVKEFYKIEAEAELQIQQGVN